MAQKSTMLLMGETGSGKSTVINYLASFFLKGTPTAPKIVIPNKIYRRPNVAGYKSAEADLDDQTCSQTSECNTYVFKRNSRDYAFIDTPGLSDTRTIDHDDENVEKILRAASEAKSLRAIVLIINGTTVRVTLNVKNVLERMAGNLPDVLLNNLIVIFTNCDKAGKNFDESSLPSPPAKSVAMNNSAFSNPPANWDKDDLEAVKFNWARSMKRIEEVLKFIDQLAPQSTQAFATMLDNRERIRMKIDEAFQQVIEQQKILQWLKEAEMEERKIDGTMKIRQLDSKHVSSEVKSKETHLKELQSRRKTQDQRLTEIAKKKKARSTSIEDSYSALRTHEREKKRLQGALYSQSDLQYTDTMKQTKSTDTPYHNTVCTSCQVTCHEDCSLDVMADQGNSGFSSCACMGKNRCRGCGCTISTHVHWYKKLEQITITQTKFHEDRVRQNQENSNKILAVQKELDDLKRQQARNQEDLQDFEDQLVLEQSKRKLTQKEEENASAERNRIMARHKEISTELDEAQRSMKALQEKKTTLQNQIQDTKRKIQSEMGNVEQSCRELKSVCSGFNFVQELNSKKERLQVHKSTLRDPQTVQEAEVMMRRIDQLALELTTRR